MTGLVGDAPCAVGADQQEEVGERVRAVRERHGRGRDGAVDIDRVDAAGASRFVRGRPAPEEGAVVVQAP
ncbi:hypothetical protein FHS34_006989 [Streptomyces echinatus]|uniref:Uncharacterized protein n=1 Tax=Streptomyces echinatus TaxID=67293 RepID=A0A7W9Q0S9_9ACTN|nr:hypothetical protein [Streptomyces echinatus]